MRRRGWRSVDQHILVRRNVEKPQTKGISSVFCAPSFSRDALPAGIGCQYSPEMSCSILSLPFSPTLTRAAPTPVPGMSGSLFRGGNAHRMAVLKPSRERALVLHTLICYIYMTAVGQAHVLPVSIVCVQCIQDWDARPFSLENVEIPGESDVKSFTFSEMVKNKSDAHIFLLSFTPEKRHTLNNRPFLPFILFCSERLWHRFHPRLNSTATKTLH